MPASIAPTGQSAERQALGFEDSLSQAALSTALVSVFRGKFCDAILPNRKAVAFKKEQVIYDVGDTARTFFFLQRGFVKVRSEEHTSELQSRLHLVCRLLLEKKK